MNVLAKAVARVREQGPRAAAASILDDARRRVVDTDREVICLKVDLTEPKNRLRKRDRKDPVEIRAFDRETLPALLEMTATHAPELTERVRKRYLEGMLGFVAYEGGEVVGYTFYTPGHGGPGLPPVHPDLTWLPIEPTPDEVYSFDYFVREDARGIGARFVRAVQEEQFRLGYTAAYGYVFASNRPAAWLYRTTGWKEHARVVEHRVLGKVAIVDRTLYWMHPHSRTPVVSL